MNTQKVSKFTNIQKIMIAAPIVLIVTMYLAFQELTTLFGASRGYVLGFMLYWGIWCTLPFLSRC